MVDELSFGLRTAHAHVDASAPASAPSTDSALAPGLELNTTDSTSVLGLGFAAVDLAVDGCVVGPSTCRGQPTTVIVLAPSVVLITIVHLASPRIAAARSTWLLRRGEEKCKVKLQDQLDPSKPTQDFSCGSLTQNFIDLTLDSTSR